MKKIVIAALFLSFSAFAGPQENPRTTEAEGTGSYSEARLGREPTGTPDEAYDTALAEAVKNAEAACGGKVELASKWNTSDREWGGWHLVTAYATFRCL